MKKLFAMLIALALLLSAAALAEKADIAALVEGAEMIEEEIEEEIDPAVEFYGEWYLNELFVNGGSLPLATFGLSMALRLNADATALISSAGMDGEGESAEGVWSLNGDVITVTLESSELTFVCSDEQLTLDVDGMTLTFGRTESDETPYAPAEAVEDAAPEDFAGSWTAVWVGFDDTWLDVQFLGDALGDPLAAAIEDTEVTLTGLMFSGDPIDTEFTGGALSFRAVDEDSGETIGITVRLLEDGSLSLTLGTGADAAVFILERDGEA